MFESICTLPLSSELFTQDLHPTEPVLAVGLSAGHVQCFRLPPIKHNENGLTDSSSVDGRGQIETQWRTRRHKGSCRTLGFSLNGDTLYSAGTDGLLKAASAETGRVSSKILIPLDAINGEVDAPTLLHVLSPQTLLVGTDSSALHLFDLRTNHSFKSSSAQSTYRPHDDYISSLTPLPPSDASTSGFSKQWVSTGGTTVAVTDLRRGVLVRSEDQEEELLSSVYVSGFPKKGTSVGEKVVVGAGNGVLTLWERGVWDDQDERIVLDRGADNAGGESVDCLVNVPAEIAGNGKMVAAGMGSGHIVCVQLGMNKVVDVFRHDEAEAVVHIGFDVGNRMISGGGLSIKVWQEKMDLDDEENGEAEETNGTDKRTLSSDEDDSDDDSSSEEEEKERRKSKKKKRRKGAQKNSVPGPGMGSFKGLD